MQCIGKTGTFPETVKISGITRVWKGFLNILTFRSSDADYPIEVMHRGDAVFILPVDRENRNVYLIRQPRHTLALLDPKGAIAVKYALSREQTFPDPYTMPFEDLMMMDVPAGMIDPGEKPVYAALRELGEETGIHRQPRDITYTRSVFSSIGGSTERLWLFIVDVGDHDTVHPKGDDVEKIEVYRMSYDEAFALLDGDLIVNAGGRLILEIFRRQLAEQGLRVCREALDAVSIGR